MNYPFLVYSLFSITCSRIFLFALFSWITLRIILALSIGLWLLVNLMNFVKSNEFLKQVATVLLILYVLFFVMTWLSSAFANLYLLFTRHGKYVLDNNERYSAIGIAITTSIALLLLIPAFTVNDDFFIVAALVASLALPMNELEFPIKLFKGSGRLITAQIMLLLGLAAFVTVFINAEIASFFGIVYFIFLVGFTWTSASRILR